MTAIAILNNNSHAFVFCDDVHTAFSTMYGTNAFTSIGLNKPLGPLVMMTILTGLQTTKQVDKACCL